MPTAMQLAERSLHTALPPRQADPLPKLITAPPPRPERGQQAEPITFGRVKAPIGSERAHLSPGRAAQVQRELMAALARRR